MKLEVIVEDLLLKTMIGSARDEYKLVLDLQENALIKKFGSRSSEAVEALETLNKSSLMFLGAYRAIQAKLSSEGIFTESVPDSFKRLYYSYCGCQAVTQFLSKNHSIQTQKEPGYSRPMPGFKIELGMSDYNAIADVLENLTKYISGSSRAEQVAADITNYFNYVSSYCLGRLYSPALFPYKETVDEVGIKARHFEIPGLKKSRKSTEKNSERVKDGERELSFEKEPTIITLEEPIEKKGVIGNDEAVNAVEIAVHHLLAYDRAAKTNPYLLDGGFCQFILLVGDSGAGKTLTFKYGISEAQRIAEPNNLDFLAVSLDFEDSYQDGPVQILRYQLNKIVNDNRPYLIFLDEMESKFSSRTSIGASNRFETKTIREFLSFANGLGYPNRGNYVFMGATNIPDQIDKAIISRFKKGTYICEGPKTAEEKARVLYNNLFEGINAGYVKICNWREIGKLAESLELSGRDLAQCAISLIEKSRTNHFPSNFYQLKFDEKLKVIKSHHEEVGDEKLTQGLYDIADKKRQVQAAAIQFMSE